MGGDYTFPIILNEVENYTSVLTTFYENGKAGRPGILGGVIIHGERPLSYASLSATTNLVPMSSIDKSLLSPLDGLERHRGHAGETTPRPQP